MPSPLPSQLKEVPLLQVHYWADLVVELLGKRLLLPWWKFTSDAVQAVGTGEEADSLAEVLNFFFVNYSPAFEFPLSLVSAKSSPSPLLVSAKSSPSPFDLEGLQKVIFS